DGFSLIMNRGNGRFLGSEALWMAAAAPSSIVSVDLNRDGAPDLVTASSNGNTLTTLLNTAGTFGRLTSSVNPAIPQQAVTFTLGLVASVSNSGIPTGDVSFKESSTLLGTAKLDGAGKATLTVSTLSQGTHIITATYPGDGNFNPKVLTLIQAVKPASSTIVSSSKLSVPLGAPVTFAVRVTTNGDSPTGNVVLFDGSTKLGSMAPDGSGSANFTLSTLAGGLHSITAVYDG